MKPVYRKYLKTTAIVWGACSALFLVLYLLVVSPQMSALKRVERQITQSKQAYEAATQAAQEKTKARLREQIERLGSSLADFVIDPADSGNLTLDISQIAGEKNVSSLSIKGKGKVTSRGSEIPGCERIREKCINISFAAGFYEFASFLNALERYRPVVFVDTFKIVRSEDGNSGNAVNMDLSVFVGKHQDSGDADTARQFSEANWDDFSLGCGRGRNDS